eukprot:c4303_g1_i1.p1 GENE.c4303_g1_i1~~c4303_g1_i1.p1  ORF type:complete len:733 (+),score=134.72 c4303_g1_i1:1-2199(+)
MGGHYLDVLRYLAALGLGPADTNSPFALSLTSPRFSRQVEHTRERHRQLRVPADLVSHSSFLTPTPIEAGPTRPVSVPAHRIPPIMTSQSASTVTPGRVLQLQRSVDMFVPRTENHIRLVSRLKASIQQMMSWLPYFNPSSSAHDETFLERNPMVVDGIEKQLNRLERLVSTANIPRSTMIDEDLDTMTETVDGSEMELTFTSPNLSRNQARAAGPSRTAPSVDLHPPLRSMVPTKLAPSQRAHTEPPNKLRTDFRDLDQAEGRLLTSKIVKPEVEDEGSISSVLSTTDLRSKKRREYSVQRYSVNSDSAPPTPATSLLPEHLLRTMKTCRKDPIVMLSCCQAILGNSSESHKSILRSRHLIPVLLKSIATHQAAVRLTHTTLAVLARSMRSWPVGNSPVNTEANEPNSLRRVFVLSNGVHIVLSAIGRGLFDVGIQCSGFSVLTEVLKESEADAINEFLYEKGIAILARSLHAHVHNKPLQRVGMVLLWLLCSRYMPALNPSSLPTIQMCILTTLSEHPADHIVVSCVMKCIVVLAAKRENCANIAAWGGGLAALVAMQSLERFQKNEEMVSVALSTLADLSSVTSCCKMLLDRDVVSACAASMRAYPRNHFIQHYACRLLSHLYPPDSRSGNVQSPALDDVVESTCNAMVTFDDDSKLHSYARRFLLGIVASGRAWSGVGQDARAAITAVAAKAVWASVSKHSSNVGSSELGALTVLRGMKRPKQSAPQE